MKMLKVFFLSTILLLQTAVADAAFFQASEKQPYHISVGAVLFNEEGLVACHHFEEVMGQKDIYILMRESMEDDETILTTLHRGLQEEFGAKAIPVAFVGALSGFLYSPVLSFDKTTLYIVCKLIEWNPENRDADDPEAFSNIEWHEPQNLMALMKQQGLKFNRVDADESEMILRALPYIQSSLAD